jgi:ATP-dependent helicase/nuclease subunit B
VRRRVSVKQLARFERCAFRFWAERFHPYEKPWWRALVAELGALERLNGARLEGLQEGFPDAARWLGEVAALLAPLSFGVVLRGASEGPYARLDAVGRSGSEYRLYTFVAPESAVDPADARSLVERSGRLHELWAAAQLLAQGAACVHLYVWPVLGRPLPVYDGGVRRTTRLMGSRQAQAARLYARFMEGDAAPKPGFGCRECAVFDLCRAGTR